MDNVVIQLMANTEIGYLYLDSLPPSAMPIRSLKFFYTIDPFAYQYHRLNLSKPYLHRCREGRRVFYRYMETWQGMSDKLTQDRIGLESLYQVPNAEYRINLRGEDPWTNIFLISYSAILPNII